MWLMNLPAGAMHLLVVISALKEAVNKLVAQNYRQSGRFVCGPQQGSVGEGPFCKERYNRQGGLRDVDG
jgi:hypothetical protein